MTHIAVLTGDIIRSRDLPAEMLEGVFSRLRETADHIASWQGADPRLTRYRGDGWQMYLKRPELALRVALVMRANLRALGAGRDTRISIAEGEGDVGDAPGLSAASGPAFIASGQGLDEMKRAATMTHASGGAIGAATVLADSISSGWTKAQSMAILNMLHPDPTTRAQVASALGKTRQTVDQALNSAGFPAIDEALRLIEGGRE